MKRPAGWPGIGPRPLAIREILEPIMKKGALARDRRANPLARRWREVAGPEIAAHTSVERFHNGALTVLCDSSALLSELASFHRAELLRKLQESHSAVFVSKLQFKLAKLPEEP